MGYSPSPRPNFTGPTHIPYEAVTRHLWGDQTSGEVADWIYVSSDKIHQLVFSLPAGGAFRHSDSYQTIFAADEVYYVLSGLLVVNNPETGEVHRVRPGEAVFFRRDTWHHGFNYSSEQLRVLELFAPPPSQGTSGAYARTKPNLISPKSGQDQWLGQWPMLQAEADRNFTMRVLHDPDALWRLEGAERSLLVGILISTNYLTVGKVHLLPGQRTEVRLHGGDQSVYVLEGNLNVRLPGHEAPNWLELKAADGCYLPQGVPYQYYNLSDRPATLIFGVAPRYLPDTE